MTDERQMEILDAISEQLRPAVGCTEPAAAAYAAAIAAQTLGSRPEQITVTVSPNILKNAMGVGIPGTDMVGLPIAVSLGALCGDASAALAVLHNVCDEDVTSARSFVNEHRVHVQLSDSQQKLYIEVKAISGEHNARAVIEGSHTHVSVIEKDGVLCSEAMLKEGDSASDDAHVLSLSEIDEFIHTVPAEKLLFLRKCVAMNTAISEEGMQNPYGLAIGRTIQQTLSFTSSEEQIAIAVTCAAADARMGGCTLPVMSCCGSGNQGLTASLPILAVAKHRNLNEEKTLRALAYSILVTIHVKRHLGRLSALCACSVGASIGTACALTYLNGGSFRQICHCVSNVVADVAGVICDGAKAGCSLKIATGVSSAFRSSMLAMVDKNATAMDGIVGCDAEASVDNLANLCNAGMTQTDRVILDILVCK